MRIFVNGELRDVNAATLDTVLAELGYCKAVIATAINGKFVATTARTATSVREGDRLEIVAPMQGG